MKKSSFVQILKPWIIPICLGLFALILTGYNAFHYPSYFDDEGTYMVQAWSFLTQGKLAPYTYWYDHAPLGWIIIAVWEKLTGGFFTFGLSINSGRVFMVVLSALSTLMVYQITKIITKKSYLGIVAGILFTASPLAVSLHRMVFLDNIMVTLFLAAWLILLTQKKLFWYAVSGFIFGCSVLVKETAPFFFPGFLLLLFQTNKKNRLFSLLLWIFMAGSVVSSFFLYALLQGEFFETGKFLGGTNPHVSLLWAYLWQGSRQGGYFLSQASQFMYTLIHSWLATDALIIIAGFFTMIINLIVGIKRKNFLVAGLLEFFYILYLIRGGIINDQYIIPLLPLFAINIALCFDIIENILKKIPVVRWARFVPVLLFVIYAAFFYLQRLNPYLIDETTAQKNALEYSMNHLPNHQVVAVEAYGLIEYFTKNNTNVYENAGIQYYWKLDQDPTITKNILHNDWYLIKYIVLGPKMKQDIAIEGLPKLKKTLENSSVIATFRNPVFNLGIIPVVQKYGHILIADSSPYYIYELNNNQSIEMTTTWDYIRSNFFKSYGQIVDPKTQTTTSKNQASAMLEAIWQNKHADFDGLLGWTKDHMEYRQNDKLLSRLMTKKGKVWVLGDYNTDTSADEDTALALLLAFYKWGNRDYYYLSQQLINDIWKNEIVNINGKYYVTIGTNADVGNGYQINTASCTPATYRLFAIYDSSHPWDLVANDCYDTFSDMQAANDIGKTVVINKDTGDIRSTKNETQSNIDLAKTETIFRIGMDLSWWKINSGNNILNTFVKTNTLGNSLIANLGILDALSFTDPKISQAFYIKNIDGKFNYKDGFWDDHNNIDEQLSGYMGAALYGKQLPGLE